MRRGRHDDGVVQSNWRLWQGALVLMERCSVSCVCAMTSYSWSGSCPLFPTPQERAYRDSSTISRFARCTLLTTTATYPPPPLHFSQNEARYCYRWDS